MKLSTRLKTLVRTAALLAACVAPANAQFVSQTPLSSGGNVPGNLLLVPSVEWPTIDSMANIEPAYVAAMEFVGYFDSDKCYKYNYSSVETDRYFYPVSTTTTRSCSQVNKEWSGNFLNWAATQTIDPFRKALTGGYRVLDTNTETILEKARSDANTGAGIYPDRNLVGGAVASSTPSPLAFFGSRVRQFGNRMRFSATGDLGSAPTAYDPGSVTLDATNANTVYEVSVRVKVCVSAALAEENCVGYGSHYKPEGLIQKYSNRIRYSAFGYLNDHTTNRDGGALRARQKFVGPNAPDPITGVLSTNSAAEWDGSTGVMIQNPDTADASATTAAVGLTIKDSGVMNYVNKFGQMTTKNHKTYDPVSELYYSALRYLRHLPNVPEYTDLGTGTNTEKYEFADGFPVITNWDDPYQYWCQNSAILGIGDVNTWNDKDLKGTTRTNSEPAMPALVAADTIDVELWTQKVATLEGIAIPTVFSGRENSAYMVGLAYWAHTQDMRTEPNMPNRQTVSTHWVDVREAQVLQPKQRNQYWLAAKYGGFRVPGADTVDTADDYNSLTNATPLTQDWWTLAGEPALATGDLRPGNFYVASDADKMVDSLTRAFAKIASERVGSGSSLAANSTRLDTETRTFQAQFRNLNFGQVNSFSVNPSDGSLSATPVWTAGTPIADAPMTPTPGVALTRANWASRTIYTNSGGSLVTFLDANLTVSQRAAMTFVGMPTAGSRATTSADVVDYLRGNNAREESETKGSLRTRSQPATGWSEILGDIVNSTPVFVGKPNDQLYSGSTFLGASSYGSFAAAQSSRLGVLYVGGNDGMLHAFNANNGKEVFAFMPNASFVNGIGEFANPEFVHKYFVDGDMAIADVYNGSAWRTVLVGTMGRGGPGVFALDVTDPTNVSFLWEKGVADIPRLGKNIGRPVIAQVADGEWRVIFGNGIDSSDGSARLVQINVNTGAITTTNTGATGSNGLSAVLARDTNADGFADTAYAGDLKGNLWKFTNLTGPVGRSSIFVAKDPGGVVQPITAAPLVGRDPSTSITWVFFGTGKYLNAADLTDSQIQTWYGIKDNGTVATRATLVARSVTSAAVLNDFVARTVSDGTTGELATAQGWYLDLPLTGERIVVPNRFQGGALIGTTRIPAVVDACQPTGKGFVMAINPFTGGKLDATFFDTNHDGIFNDSDKRNGEIVSGIGFDSSANNPIFVENVMQVGLDDGTTKTVRTQGTNVDASRMSWREILN
jgi:type IV pilus assembly protein PilY1